MRRRCASGISCWVRIANHWNTRATTNTFTSGNASGGACSSSQRICSPASSHGGGENTSTSTIVSSSKRMVWIGEAVRARSQIRRRGRGEKTEREFSLVSVFNLVCPPCPPRRILFFTTPSCFLFSLRDANHELEPGPDSIDSADLHIDQTQR